MDQLLKKGWLLQAPERNNGFVEGKNQKFVDDRKLSLVRVARPALHERQFAAKTLLQIPI